MKNFSDIETLCAYLDGELDQNNAARLEARLKTDLELASVMNDLRAARSVLRQLPARKAPRNFTLTRRMVGLKPPLPRAYPLLRFATSFAAILFLFSFAANALTPMFSFGASAPAPAFGMGGGCEGPCEEAAIMEAPAPAATEAAAEESFAQDSAPAATEAPPLQESAPLATQPAAATEDSARIGETTATPALKEGGQETELPVEETAPETANQPTVTPEPRLSINWTLLFFVISLVGAVSLWVMRLTAKRKWR